MTSSVVWGIVVQEFDIRCVPMNLFSVDIFIIMDINALLINSIFDKKKTFGMFYELILQNEI